MGLILVNHGGMCCGIKTIYEFGTGDKIEDALEKLPRNNSDLRYDYGMSNQRFFTDPAPEESTTCRLDRYIDFVKAWRPQHVIEAVLCEPQGPEYMNQLPFWAPELEMRGFVPVTSAKNSNSGNRIHIYHLIIDEKE